MSKMKGVMTMGNKKRNRNNDLTLTKLLIVKAILELLNVIIAIIAKLVDT